MQKQKCGEFQKKRIADLDKLSSWIYEDNVIGKLSDERYSRIVIEYEPEQKELRKRSKEGKTAPSYAENRIKEAIFASFILWRITKETSCKTLFSLQLREQMTDA